MVSDSSKDIQTPSPPPNSLPPSLGTNFQVIYNNTLMRNTPPLPVSTPNRPSPTLPHNPPTSASYYQDDQILTQNGLYAIKTNQPPATSLLCQNSPTFLSLLFEITIRCGKVTQRGSLVENECIIKEKK